MKLNYIKCKSSKPKEKPYKLSDGGGMYLEIMPNGGKFWRLKYRYNNKEKRLSFGKFPLISLDEARDKRDEAKKILAEGNDPSIIKREEKILKSVSSANTFESIAKEWLEKKETEVKANTYKDIVNRLELNLFPQIGKLPIKNVTAPILIESLRKVEKRNALDTVKRLRQYSSQIFRYAIAHGKAEYNPAGDISEALKTRKSEHFKSMPFDKLPDFLNQIETNDDRLYMQTRLALKLMVLTFTRKTELSHAKWDEVDFKNKVWTVPAERMKMGKEHIVPLARQSLEIFKQLKEMNEGWDYVFPSMQKPKQPMHEDTILRAIYRLGYKGIATIHGFRSLAMTLIMEKLGYRYEVPDLQLAHEKTDKIRAAYDRAEFMSERIKMMQDWADYIDKLRGK
jgi:integrase